MTKADNSKQPRIVIVAAVAANGVIGRDGRLPWHLPADLAHFKRLTLDKPLLMGRRTWESLPGRLPRRTHIVVSSQPDYEASGCIVVADPDAGIAAAGDAPEIMVIGGAQLYRTLLPRASRMVLSLVAAHPSGDTYFPEWGRADWQEVEHTFRARDANNPYDITFSILERRPA